MKDLLMLYRNYLFAIQERQEYGDRYGDTDELMEMYEKRLNLKRGETNEKRQNRNSTGNIDERTC